MNILTKQKINWSRRINQKIFFVFGLITTLIGSGFTQAMEVDGKLKVTEMDLANSENLLVVKQTDGTLATRDAATLSAGEPSVYAVGDYAQGGVVFYVDASGKHGKVLYMYDMGYIRWSNVDDTYNFDAAWSLNNGAGNTSAIGQHQNHIFSAASLCSEMAYGGFDDWYLPALNELNQLYNARTIVEQTLTAIGGEGFGTRAYWSSTEDNSNATKAWAWKFSDGTSALGTKSGFGYARAIRSF